MLCISLLIPVIMMITGRYFRDHTPEKISPVFGYRTTRSTRNRDTWVFANGLMGRIWCRWSLWLLPLSAAVMVPVMGKDETVISCAGGVICVLQLVLIFLSIRKIEQALKQTFDEKGNRK